MNTQKMSDTEPRYVLHIAPLNRWERAVADGQGDYIDPSLEAERFIHCSTHEQVLIPANERFAGRDDLVLLSSTWNWFLHARCSKTVTKQASRSRTSTGPSP